MYATYFLKALASFLGFLAAMVMQSVVTLLAALYVFDHGPKEYLLWWTAGIAIQFLLGVSLVAGMFCAIDSDLARERERLCRARGAAHGPG